MRAHVKGLPDSKSWAFVAEAVEAGDLPTVSAILAAQPFLSGLSPKLAQNARQMPARKFAPVHYEQLVATEKVIDRVKAVSHSFLGRFAKVLDLRNTLKVKADAGLAMGARKRQLPQVNRGLKRQGRPVPTRRRSDSRRERE